MVELRLARRAIEELDTAILDLIAARMKAAELIREAKESNGLPVLDEERMQKRLGDIARQAEEKGIPVSAARCVFEKIMLATAQSQAYKAIDASFAIYGYGAVARTLARMLSSAGYEVTITGRSMEKAKALASELGLEAAEPARAAEAADVTIAAVPPEGVEVALTQLREGLKPGTVFCEACSVKTPVASTVLSRLPSTIDYVGLHPLFGPLDLWAGETVVLIPVRDRSSWTARLRKVFEALALRVTVMSVEEHDKAMAISQALHHLVLELLQRAMSRLRGELGIDEVLATHSLRSTLQALARHELLSYAAREVVELNPFTSFVKAVLAEEVFKLLGGDG